VFVARGTPDIPVRLPMCKTSLHGIANSRNPPAAVQFTAASLRRRRSLIPRPHTRRPLSFLDSRQTWELPLVSAQGAVGRGGAASRECGIQPIALPTLLAVPRRRRSLSPIPHTR